MRTAKDPSNQLPCSSFKELENEKKNLSPPHPNRQNHPRNPNQ